MPLDLFFIGWLLVVQRKIDLGLYISFINLAIYTCTYNAFKAMGNFSR